MDPEQTAPEQSDLGPHCLPKRLLKHFSRREKQTTFVAFGALRVKYNGHRMNTVLMHCSLMKMSIFITVEEERKMYKQRD